MITIGSGGSLNKEDCQTRITIGLGRPLYQKYHYRMIEPGAPLEQKGSEDQQTGGSLNWFIINEPQGILNQGHYPHSSMHPLIQWAQLNGLELLIRVKRSYSFDATLLIQLRLGENQLGLYLTMRMQSLYNKDIVGLGIIIDGYNF